MCTLKEEVRVATDEVEHTLARMYEIVGRESTHSVFHHRITVGSALTLTFIAVIVSVGATLLVV